MKLLRRVKCDENQLLSQGELEECIKNTDVIQLNVGGEIMMTTRETLTRFPKSILSMMFNGDWEQRLPMDKNGNIFLDFNPILFRHLLDQLQLLDKNNIISFYFPSHPSLIEPFKKMLRKLNLNQFLPLENNIITFNIGGQTTRNQPKTFNHVNNTILDKIISSSNIMKFHNKSNVFLDYHPKLFQHLIKQLRKKSSENICYSNELSNQENIFFKKLFPDLNICRAPLGSSLTDIPPNAKWDPNGYTVAGKNPALAHPRGLYVDDDQTIYVADYNNHRITAWKMGETKGQVVAGGHGQGNGDHQLNIPTAVIVDKERDKLIICDHGNKRIVRWSRENGTSGETIIHNIACVGVTMDENRSLYISDIAENEIRKYRVGESQGTVVAGGNGKGNRLDQLDYPAFIFVNQEHSVFVADYNNHRVMKWREGAKEGTVVAGGQGQGGQLTQLNNPSAVLVDQLDTIYVADSRNNRIVRWLKGEQQVIAGGYGAGAQANQLNWPTGLSFDRFGHLYVADLSNSRIQRFTIKITSNKWD